MARTEHLVTCKTQVVLVQWRPLYALIVVPPFSNVTANLKNNKTAVVKHILVYTSKSKILHC